MPPYLELSRWTTHQNVIVSSRGSTWRDARSLSSFASRGRHRYDVVVHGIHLRPLRELIPFSSRASILFLLEDVKLARLILSYAVFLLRSYAWESQPGDSLRTVYLYSIPWHSGPPCLVAISYLYSILVTWDQVDKSLLSLVGARLHYKSTFNA